MAAEFRPVAPVDPTNLRPMLFLDVAREMMLGNDWSHRAVTVVMESHTGPGKFTFYGANHPDVVDEVHAGLVDVSILNLVALEAQGFRRGLLEQSRYPSLPGDILTVDYSGWPIYCQADAPDALVEKFCQALITRRDAIVWDIGGPQQPPLPLDRMARESPSTPQDVPLHPAAAAVWRAHGFL